MTKLSICLLLALAFLGGCATKGSEDWCDEMKKKNYSDWTGSDAKTYASHCLTDSTTIGSDKWCKSQKDQDFSQWTHEETSNYVKTCLLD